MSFKSNKEREFQLNIKHIKYLCAAASQNLASADVHHQLMIKFENSNHGIEALELQLRANICFVSALQNLLKMEV